MLESKSIIIIVILILILGLTIFQLFFSKKQEGPQKSMITAWSGDINNIPAGWVLCDGKNGTPNLRGRFIFSYNPKTGDNNDNTRYGWDIGDQTGIEEVKLTKDEVPVGDTPAIYSHQNMPPSVALAYIMKL